MQRTLILLLCLSSSPVFSAQNLTIEQLQTIKLQAQAAKDCSDRILSFAQYATTLTQNNFSLSFTFSSDKLTLTPSQQSDMTLYYQSLKANCLQTAVNLLP